MEATIAALRQPLNNDCSTLNLKTRRIPEDLPKNALGDTYANDRTKPEEQDSR